MKAEGADTQGTATAKKPYSIVVLMWKSAGEVPGLVESIDEHLETEHELIFVDNGSDDGSAESLSTRISASAPATTSASGRRRTTS
jgi:hypothetical protein